MAIRSPTADAERGGAAAAATARPPIDTARLLPLLPRHNEAKSNHTCSKINLTRKQFKLTINSVYECTNGQ